MQAFSEDITNIYDDDPPAAANSYHPVAQLPANAVSTQYATTTAPAMSTPKSPERNLTLSNMSSRNTHVVLGWMQNVPRDARPNSDMSISTSAHNYIRPASICTPSEYSLPSRPQTTISTSTERLSIYIPPASLPPTIRDEMQRPPCHGIVTHYNVNVPGRDVDATVFSRASLSTKSAWIKAASFIHRNATSISSRSKCTEKHPPEVTRCYRNGHGQEYWWRQRRYQTYSGHARAVRGHNFGTTYSGVSWAFSGAPFDIKDVRQFRSVNGNKDEARVPTILDTGTKSWGYLVDDSRIAIRWLKLLLLREQDIRDDVPNAPYLQAARKHVTAMGTDGVINLVIDYLDKLWQHFLEQIKVQVDSTTLETLPFKVALTIPGIWPQYAHKMMMEAARRAGILNHRAIANTTLILVEEPEAAALATLFDRREYGDMTADETFIVVDCGGGTVDIISYKVKQLDPFVISEVVKGDGKLCGAFLADEKFEQHMKKHSRFKNCSESTFRKFVNSEWETVKRNFNPDMLTKVHMNVPPEARPVIRWRKEKGSIELDVGTIKGFFQDTYQGTCDLIQDQINKIQALGERPPKKIILVGGLGNPRYLRTMLQYDFGNIIQPQNPLSAVAHGAVIKLLKNTLSELDVVVAMDKRQNCGLNKFPTCDIRVARRSYGIQVGIPVREALPPIDPSADFLYDEPHRQKGVWRMKWYIQQGDLIDNHDPVSYRFYDYINNPAQRHTEFTIYTSETMPPPIRLDPNCDKLCIIKCNYDTPFHELPVVDKVRGMRRVDNMRLTMRFNGVPSWHLQVGQNVEEYSFEVEYTG